MADRLHANSEWLDRAAHTMAEIQASLSAARSSLSGLNLRRDEGGDLKVSLNCALRLAHVSYNGNNAQDDIRQLARASQALSDRVGALSQGATAAARAIESAESAAAKLMASVENASESTVYNEGGGGVNMAAAAALGFFSDPSTWSKDMQQQYNDFIANGQTFVDDHGRTILISGDKTVISNPDGSITVVDASWREASAKTYNPDGSYYSDEVGLTAGSSVNGPKIKRPDIPGLGGEGYDGPSFDKTILQVGAKSTSTASVIHLEDKYTKGAYSSTSTMDIGKVTATAGIYGGLYTIKTGPDGQQTKVLSPGVKAEIGVSVSAIEASHKGRIGNDIAGFDYGVSAKGPSASATASAELGIVDGKAAAHVSAKAEAIVAEVGGEVGVDVMGFEGKVKGSVNYGIGAHADIGFDGNKVSCDIGASLGVGGSVKFELDYGKAVDKAVDFASSAIEKGKKTYSALKDLGHTLYNLR